MNDKAFILMGRHRRSLTLTAALLLVAMPGVAQEQATGEGAMEACITAHETAQRARNARKYLESREALKGCTVNACPTLIRRDCLAWSEEVTNAIPTLILAARSIDGDLTDVTVKLDGKVVATRLDGAPIEVTPGPHVLVFQVPGYPPLRQQVVASEGVKNRLITASFQREKEAEAPEPEPTRSPNPEPTHRPIPVLTYVLGGTSLALLGAGVGFGVHASSVRDDKASGCAPACSAEAKSEVTTPALVADLLYGGAAAAAVSAVVLYVLRPSVPLKEQAAMPLRLVTRAGRTSAFLGVAGRF